MRIKLEIEYDGTYYSGWQVQKNTPRTIQGKIQEALTKILKTDEYELYGSGRTDAGVHALGQVAHLETNSTISPGIVKTKVNHLLPKDIFILEAETVPPGFHARHDAEARSYLYQICRRRSSFGQKFVYTLQTPLDMKKIRTVIDLFCGFKDYSSFSRDDIEEKSRHVFIESIETREMGSLLLFRITGSHFLWKMVRQMVGVMLEVGMQRLAIGQVKEMLTAQSSLPAQLTVPPRGLFLERVYYPGDKRLKEIQPVLFIR